jgi:tetratricopeptide (TPR) repeat protein
MRPNLEIIDEYLAGSLSDTEKAEINMQILKDKAFAKDFAMTLMAKKAAKEAADIERKKDFESLKSGMDLQKNDNIFSKRYAKAWAAAASIALIIGIFTIFNIEPNQEEIANNYIKNELTELPVLMGTDTDSLQKAIEFYNKKSYSEAAIIFEKLANQNPKSLEYYGLTALQLEQYDKASTIFEKLSAKEEFKSRAKLLQALSLIKKGDKAKSQEIIKAINKKDLSLEDREFIQDMAVKN